MSKESIKVSGMSCGHCEKAVVEELTEAGVSVCKADAGKGEVYVEFDPTVITLAKIKEVINETGYEADM